MIRQSTGQSEVESPKKNSVVDSFSTDYESSYLADLCATCSDPFLYLRRQTQNNSKPGSIFLVKSEMQFDVDEETMGSGIPGVQP
jgi:hypothetical protein